MMQAIAFEPIARQRWRSVRKLLAVRLDNLSDVLMTTPALAAIRQSVPAAHITLLTSASGAAAQGYLSDVDDVIPYDAPWMKEDRGEGRQATPDDELAMVHRLASEQFDAAIIFTCYTQSALPAAMLCRQAGIALRLAYSRENPYGLLSDWVSDPEPAQGIRHEVERQLALVRAVGYEADDDRMSFDYRSEELHSLCIKLASVGVTPKRPWVVVHPGASAPSRRYPTRQIGAAADLIARHVHCHLLFTGSADEAELILGAQRSMQKPGTSLAGKLTLGELAALIAHSKVLVSSNSAPVHIAAAVGTPVVDLCALTSSQQTPWRVPARVLNHEVPVTPEAVAQAAQELIELRPDHAAHEPDDEHGVEDNSNTASAAFALTMREAVVT